MHKYLNLKKSQDQLQLKNLELEIQQLKEKNKFVYDTNDHVNAHINNNFALDSGFMQIGGVAPEKDFFITNINSPNPKD